MSNRGALEGIRVLELGQVMAGPFCALQLCDMGADVIKVEPPDGDPTRQMGARAGTDSACFAAMNRGKRGIVLDLKSAAGRDALAALKAGLYVMQQGGYMSEYDLHVSGKVAHVLCGGKLSSPQWVDEQYFLDLEREAFVSLCGEQKTIERITHMLTTGKPLRN
jgi:hypothetical protein